MSDLADYHHPKAYEQLLGYVEKHEMQILHEDGLYRHLRFMTPGSSIGYFDLITWPGSLAIRGDIGEGFIFTREQDMIPWFNTRSPGHINPQYWSEKLDRGTREVRSVFSEEAFEKYLKGQVEGFAEAHSHDHEAVKQYVTEMREWGWVGDANSAYQFMNGLSYEGDVIDESLSDNAEMWLEYDHHFLIACHAILWGVQKYMKERNA